MESTGRRYLCAACRAAVLICSHCDRGQRYCAAGCAQRARAASLRAAGTRYQASFAPEFDSSKAHFRPTPSNGAGFRATGRQKPRYTGC